MQAPPSQAGWTEGRPGGLRTPSHDRTPLPHPHAVQSSSEVLAPSLAQLNSDTNSPAISGKHSSLQPGSWGDGGCRGEGVFHPPGPETAKIG